MVREKEGEVLPGEVERAWCERVQASQGQTRE